MRALALIMLMLLAVPAMADENRADARIEVSVGPFVEAPYEQEMILLTIRGWYGVPITRESLTQPALPGFAWMQLGRDRWFDTDYQGRQLRGYERTMALFAQEPGVLEIPSFEHDLKLMSIRGQRFEQVIQSPPITVEVRPRPTTGIWLPASGVRIVEQWDRRPDQLEFGQAAERTVTLIAAGVSPEMLPSTPDLSSPGIHVFPHPEERARNLTPKGPVSSVTWRWTVTLLRPEAAVLNSVEIPWFDTVSREMGTVTLPAYRVAIKGSNAVDEDARALQWMTRHAGLTGGVAGAVLGLLIVLWRRRLVWRDPALAAHRLRRRTLKALARAARAGDAPAMRRHAYRLMQRAPSQPARQAMQAALAPLDQALFGAAGTGAPDLRTIARQIGAHALSR